MCVIFDYFFLIEVWIWYMLEYVLSCVRYDLSVSEVWICVCEVWISVYVRYEYVFVRCDLSKYEVWFWGVWYIL